MAQALMNILQFGEGNFLRGFADWMVQRMNDRAGFGGTVGSSSPAGRSSTPSRASSTRRAGATTSACAGRSGARPSRNWRRSPA